MRRSLVQRRTPWTAVIIWCPNRWPYCSIFLVHDEGIRERAQSQIKKRRRRKVSHCPLATLPVFVYLLSRSLHSAFFFTCTPSREKPASASTPVCGAPAVVPRKERGRLGGCEVPFGSFTSSVFLIVVFLRFGIELLLLIF
jgi:hypothetical protein